MKRAPPSITLHSIVPPAGIKTLSTVNDEVIMQPVIRWAANPNIAVAVKYKGVKATVQVRTGGPKRQWWEGDGIAAMQTVRVTRRAERGDF